MGMGIELDTTTNGGPLDLHARRLSDATLDLLDRQLAANSRRAYATDVAHVHAFVTTGQVPERRQVLEGDDDALMALEVWQATKDPTVLAEYVTACTGTLKPSTIARRIAAVAKLHARAAALTGQPDSRPTSDPLVRQVMASARNAYAEKVRQVPEATVVKKASALMSQDLRAILDAIDPTTVKGARDAALIALGWHGAFRRSELVDLQVEDLEPVLAGLEVRLRFSKTDQAGSGRTVPIYAYPEDPQHCPVALVNRWLEVSGVANGPVFRQVTRQGNVKDLALGGQAVCRILEERAAAAGISRKDLTPHSLRAGRLTQGAREGHTLTQLQAVSGHRSQAILMGYLRDANPHAAGARVTI